MTTYTVEVTWNVPEYIHVTVEAERPERAMELALAEAADNPDGYRRTLDYDNSGQNDVTGLWEGDEAYPDADEDSLPLPPTPRMALDHAIQAVVAHLRHSNPWPAELRDLIAAHDNWRQS